MAIKILGSTVIDNDERLVLNGTDHQIGGDATISSNLTVGTDLTVGDDIYVGDDLNVAGDLHMTGKINLPYIMQHTGDTDTQIKFETEKITITADTTYINGGAVHLGTTWADNLGVTGTAILPKIDTLHLLTQRHGGTVSCGNFCEDMGLTCVEGRFYDVGGWNTNNNPHDCWTGSNGGSTTGFTPVCLCEGIIKKWNDI